MYLHWNLADHYMHEHVADLHREAAHERLAAMAERARGPRRPVRARLADWLISVADRLDDGHTAAHTSTRGLASS